jgi:hypothetical protein
MESEQLSDDLPLGIYFYWEEPEDFQDHPKYWAQLCGSLHRLAYVRDELEKVTTKHDTCDAVRALEYHIENYLARIYELRERIAKLLVASSGRGEIGRLKGKRTRNNEIVNIFPENPDICEDYLCLLSLLDDDIALRNQNTHDTFLSLGYSNGLNIYAPIDLLTIDTEPGSDIHQKFQEDIKQSVEEAISRYTEKIQQILQISRKLLFQLDFRENFER